jgi:EAL domain-containing protein (putative c-di-GMP-specific phosphodiesterase class I)
VLPPARPRTPADERRAAAATRARGRVLTPRWAVVGRAGWVGWLVVAALLAVAWAVVVAAGGTRTSLPHVFYVPIVVAALAAGVPGGVVVGVLAGLLCGPLLPLDVATGEGQAVGNWLTRGAFFVAVGALVGAGSQTLRRLHEDRLGARFRAELDLTPPPAPPDDPALDAAVEAVLAERRFEPVYQPIHALDDGHLLAVEALTRFGRGTAAPDHWFAAAARRGVGVELELAAIEAALDASRVLPREVGLSVNASPATLADPRLSRLLGEHLDRAVIVEVTEHAAVADYHELDLALARLRRRGVRLAIDDVGAGFSSLRHIVRLAPDVIKLDPSLASGLGGDPIRRALAGALVQFAAQTGTLLIVEGIESIADLRHWQDLGADAAQGFLLGAPGPLPVPLVSPQVPVRPRRWRRRIGRIGGRRRGDG